MTSTGRQRLRELAREALPLDKVQHAAAEEGINELDDGEADRMAHDLEHALSGLPDAIADVDAALTRHGMSMVESQDVAATGRSILVLDDDDAFAQRVVEKLAKMGYNARHVGTAEEAKAALALTPSPSPSPFMVLADVTMTHVDGYALLEQIKSAVPGAATVVMTLAKDDALEAVAKQCHRIGARYLDKSHGSTALSLQLATLVAAAKMEP